MIILLLGTAGYLGYQNIQLRKQIGQVQATPSPTSTPDPAADWEMYKSEKFGYQFNHPKSLKIESKDQRVHITFENWGLVVWTFPNTKQLSLQELLDQAEEYPLDFWKDYIVEPTPNFEINSVPALKYWDNLASKGKMPDECGNQECPVLHVEFIHKDKLYHAVLGNHKEYDPTIENLFDQILSTFEFTD